MVGPESKPSRLKPTFFALDFAFLSVAPPQAALLKFTFLNLSKCAETVQFKTGRFSVFSYLLKRERIGIWE